MKTGTTLNEIEEEIDTIWFAAERGVLHVAIAQLFAALAFCLEGQMQAYQLSVALAIYHMCVANKETESFDAPFEIFGRYLQGGK
jgi:hypothetical protein